MTELKLIELEAQIQRLEELVIYICDLNVQSAPVHEITLEMNMQSRGTWWTPLPERVEKLKEYYNLKDTV